MAEESKIEWTESTASPWIGCTKVSPGCRLCYAESLDARRFSKTLPGGSHWGKGAPRHYVKKFRSEALKWHRKANEAKMFRRVFPSLCDWLDDEVPVEWLAEFLETIAMTPCLQWQLLTKRPELFQARMRAVVDSQSALFQQSAGWAMARDWLDGEAPENVWFGFSAENQKTFDARMVEALNVATVCRWISVEPMLAPISINEHKAGTIRSKNFVDWVVIGGESDECGGSAAARCEVNWIADLVKELRGAYIRPFVKQLGSCPTRDGRPMNLAQRKGQDWSEWPEEIRVREMPAAWERLSLAHELNK